MNYRIIERIKEKFPIEKRDEVYTVINFLINESKDFQFNKENIEIFPEEPADIFVKDINKKFQVSWGDHDQFYREAKTKPDDLVHMPTRTRRDIFREYVIRPLNKKNKYGKSANGITYLIRAPFDPPWIEEDIKNLRKTGTNSILKKLGFDEIFLVCSDKNIRIYP